MFQGNLLLHQQVNDLWRSSRTVQQTVQNRGCYVEGHARNYPERVAGKLYPQSIFVVTTLSRR